MAEGSMPWGGTATGDAAGNIFDAPYSDDEWSDAWGMLFLSDRTTMGVLYTARTGYTNNLQVTNPSGTTIRMGDGLALVDGKLYANDANIDNTVVQPGSNSNYYRIVLRKDFSAQTVTCEMLGPTNAAAGGTSWPALTQTDGTTWEIPIAGIEYESAGEGGAINITDQREFVSVGLPDNTTIGFDSYNRMYVKASGVDTLQLAADAVDGTKIADDSINSEHYVDGSIDTAHIANEQVTAAKIANRTRIVCIPPVYAKVGASTHGEIDETVGRDWKLPDSTYAKAFGYWVVPQDFYSTLKLRVAIYSLNSGDVYGRLTSVYGGDGEAYNVGGGDSGYTTETLVASNIAEKFECTVAGAAAGDILSVWFYRDPDDVSDDITADVYIRCFIAEYIADS